MVSIHRPARSSVVRGLLGGLVGLTVGITNATQWGTGENRWKYMLVIAMAIAGLVSEHSAALVSSRKPCKSPFVVIIVVGVITGALVGAIVGVTGQSALMLWDAARQPGSLPERLVFPTSFLSGYVKLGALTGAFCAGLAELHRCRGIDGTPRR